MSDTSILKSFWPVHKNPQFILACTPKSSIHFGLYAGLRTGRNELKTSAYRPKWIEDSCVQAEMI